MLTICPFFQGNSAFLSCMKDIVKWWEPLTYEYRKEVKKIVEDSLGEMRNEACGVSESLINCVELEWRHYCVNLFKDFETKCNAALNKELDFGTSNHNLNSKFYEEQILPTAMMGEIIQTVVKNCSRRERAITTEDLQKELAPDIMKIRENWSLRFRGASLHEQQRRRLYAAVVAAWSS
eukprot:TRINITY_DN4318_c0_g1_i1.p1 TRINITY_DN4318_c0_g1~~TRINITY_DN4318_c0_g1_i1.p1  ORF type:complete len:179 (+),score=20.30 TRINITY_DN4318_c0_g1_i1:133-669(+)